MMPPPSLRSPSLNQEKIFEKHAFHLRFKNGSQRKTYEHAPIFVRPVHRGAGVTPHLREGSAATSERTFNCVAALVISWRNQGCTLNTIIWYVRLFLQRCRRRSAPQAANGRSRICLPSVRPVCLAHWLFFARVRFHPQREHYSEPAEDEEDGDEVGPTRSRPTIAAHFIYDSFCGIVLQPFPANSTTMTTKRTRSAQTVSK